MTHAPSGERRGPGRPLDPGAHRRILAAAVGLLGERGASGWSVAEVAERAGVGKATVYRHWADKDDLMLDALQAMLLQEIPVPDTGTLAGDMAAVYAAELEFAASDVGTALIRFLVHESTRDDRFRALFRRSLASSRDAADVMVDRAIGRGEVPADVDRELLWEVLPARLMFRLVTGDPLPSPDAAAQLVERVLDGFRGR